MLLIVGSGENAMSLFQDSRIRAAIVIAFVAIAGPVAAFSGVGHSAAPAAICDQPQSCTVKGAKLDEPVKLHNRAPGY